MNPTPPTMLPAPPSAAPSRGSARTEVPAGAGGMAHQAGQSRFSFEGGTPDNQGPKISQAFHSIQDLCTRGHKSTRGRRCTKCGVWRRAEHFSPDKRAPDGLKSRCKACLNADTKAYRAKYPERCRASARRGYAKHRAKEVRRSRDWAARHPLAATARHAVHRAIRAGRLVLPDTCEDCACFLDGKYDCHHPDYSQRLSVIVLCRSCHSSRGCAEGRHV